MIKISFIILFKKKKVWAHGFVFESAWKASEYIPDIHFYKHNVQRCMCAWKS